MTKPTALRATAISKSFKLPHEKHSTLKSVVINPFSKKRGTERQQVLSDVSFEIEEGEFFGIVGRNGGGKSTLLKILAGIYEPDSGGVEIAGKLVPFIELGVGFNPELSGRDNVYLNGALLGFSDSEIDDIYDDIVSFAELERFMDQKLKNYSSGMQVRLAFSLATRSKADILLVDEVLAVGDVAFQRKCYNYFSSLRKDKKTVIFISHDMDAVREYCTRAILIDSGKIVAAGSAETIAEQYMKLFSANPTGKKKSERWGDGSVQLKADIRSVTDNFIEIEARITAKQDVDDQVVGMSVQSADGVMLCGTNTDLLRQKVPAMKKNDAITLQWRIPNIFNNGSYAVSLASHGHGGLPVYDWWNNALSVEIVSGRQSPYPVSPPITMKISSR